MGRAWGESPSWAALPFSKIGVEGGERMFVKKKVGEAADHLRQRYRSEAATGLFLDNGMGGFSNELGRLTVAPCRKIPHFPQPLTTGYRSTLLFGTVGEEKVVVQEGRDYLYEGYFHRELAFPLRVLAELGMRKLLLVAWMHPLRPEWQRGDLVLVTDHIDLTGGSPLMGLPPPEGLAYPMDMTAVYSSTFQKEARHLGDESGVPLKSAVMAMVPGPAGPTGAEGRMYSGLGIDVLSMSLAAEIAMALYLGVEIAVFGLVLPAPGEKRSRLPAEGWTLRHVEYFRDLLRRI